MLELAAQEVEGAGNVTLRQGDVRTLQEQGYDVVYARFLLIHMADVADVLRRMAGCLAPGGMVVVEDVDTAGSSRTRRTRRTPAQPVVRRADHPPRRRCQHRAEASGAAAAGWAGGVGLRIVQPAFMTGPVKHVHAVTLTSISESLVAEAMVSVQDARTFHAEMTRYADDETTIVTWPRIVQAWGRLPASNAVTRGDGTAWMPPPSPICRRNYGTRLSELVARP